MELPAEAHVSNIPPAADLFSFFLLPPVNVTILPFTCQSREIRKRGLTDMLDKRAVTSTERLNRLASPPSGRADTPGINQAAASPQPGASRVANNAAVTPKGKCECGGGGEAHRKQEAVSSDWGLRRVPPTISSPFRCSD